MGELGDGGWARGLAQKPPPQGPVRKDHSPLAACELLLHSYWLGRGEEASTHSVFGIDIQAQGKKVFHDLHMSSTDGNVQGSAQ